MGVMGMSKKRKGPVIGRVEDDEIERRPFEVTRETLEAPSNRVVYFNCPFCREEVKAYVWSLCGGGKRCNCGAYFGSWGTTAVHWKDKERRR